MVTAKDLAARLGGDSRIVVGFALGMGEIPEAHSRCYFFTDAQAKAIEKGFTAAKKHLQPPKRRGKVEAA